jgi:hypothetical protein
MRLEWRAYLHRRSRSKTWKPGSRPQGSGIILDQDSQHHASQITQCTYTFAISRITFSNPSIHFHGTCGGGDASRFFSQVFSRAEALKGIRHSRMDSFTRFRTLHFTTYSYSPHPRPCDHHSGACLPTHVTLPVPYHPPPHRETPHTRAQSRVTCARFRDMSTLRYQFNPPQPHSQPYRVCWYTRATSRLSVTSPRFIIAGQMSGVRTFSPSDGGV